MLVGGDLKGIGIQRTRGKFTSRLDEELLGCRHVQAHRLLGPLDVPRQRIALDLVLANLQYPHQRKHCHSKDHHGHVGNGPVPVR